MEQKIATYRLIDLCAYVSWLVDKIDEYITKIKEHSVHFDLLKRAKRIRDEVLHIRFLKPEALALIERNGAKHFQFR